VEALVSIIIPVYNGEFFLKESLKSCVQQTYKNIEIIIVNDCSSDTSLAIAQEFASTDSRIRIINNEVNKRLPASLNIGHYAAKGEYISWTSDDNIYDVTAIACLVAAIKSKNKDIAVAGFSVIESNATFKRLVLPWEQDHLLLGNSVGACFLYKKQVFTRNKGYNESLHTVEDYDFWLRALLHSSYVFVKQDLYKYRLHESSLTNQIQQDVSAKSLLFEEKLERMYLNFFITKNTRNAEFMASVLYRLHRNVYINVADLLSDFEIFKSEIIKIETNQNQAVFKNIWTSIDLRLRRNILTFKKNQNIKTLKAIYSNRSDLLTKYDRRRSLSYVFKCLGL
jgi:glycosyltransferase involved in cell wall biosynthesis